MKADAATAAGTPIVEEALQVDCAGEALVGIVSRPAVGAGAADTGVVIVVGGPQYRAGAHRQFTLLARSLASAGYPVLRFDVRGMGDSTGAQRSFEALDADVQAACAALPRAVPGVRRVVLWGLCDGASAALLALPTLPAASAAAGLCLLNPWVRSAASLARTQVKHYYRQRLMEPAFWRKLLSGGVAGQALKDLLANLRTARTGHATAITGTRDLPFQQRMAQAWSGFSGPVLLLLSERDATAQEFGEFSRSDPAWQQALRQRPPETVRLPDADHTCSSPAAQRAAEEATAAWLRRHFPPARAAAVAA
jgi:uncharacterized protein